MWESDFDVVGLCGSAVAWESSWVGTRLGFGVWGCEGLGAWVEKLDGDMIEWCVKEARSVYM